MLRFGIMSGRSLAAASPRRVVVVRVAAGARGNAPALGASGLAPLSRVTSLASRASSSDAFAKPSESRRAEDDEASSSSIQALLAALGAVGALGGDASECASAKPEPADAGAAAESSSPTARDANRLQQTKNGLEAMVRDSATLRAVFVKNFSQFDIGAGEVFDACAVTRDPHAAVCAALHQAMPLAMAWLGRAAKLVDVAPGRVGDCATAPFARDADDETKAERRLAALNYEEALTAKAVEVAGARPNEQLIFSGTSGSGENGAALVLRYARAHGAERPLGRLPGGAAVPKNITRIDPFLLKANARDGEGLAEEEAARARGALSDDAAARGARSGESAAPTAAPVLVVPSIGAKQKRAVAPDAGERPATRLADAASAAAAATSSAAPTISVRGALDAAASGAGARRPCADAATAGEPASKKPRALVGAADETDVADVARRAQLADVTSPLLRVPGDGDAAPAPAEARAPPAPSSRAGEKLCLTAYRVALGLLHENGQQRTAYSTLREAVDAGYDLHKQRGDLQTDAECFFARERVVYSSNGTEEPDPADRASVNGVVMDALREHLVPQFHTVKLRGRLAREAFEAHFLARPGVCSVDVSSVYCAAANVLCAAMGVPARKAPLYWQAKLVFAPEGDIFVQASDHPCAPSAGSFLNRCLASELEAVAFRASREYLVPPGASPLKWSSGFSSVDWRPSAIFDDDAYARWTEQRDGEDDTRVARSRRILANDKAGTEPAPHALLGVARFFAGCSDGGSWSAHAVLADHGVDLGGKPAAEVHAALVASGVPLHEDVEVAFAALAGSAKGVSLADRAARDTVFTKELAEWEASDWTCVEPNASSAKFKVTVGHKGDKYRGGSFTRARHAAELVDALKVELGCAPVNFPREHVLDQRFVDEAQAIIAKVQKDKAKPAEAEVVTPEKKCARCSGLFCVMREEKLWTWHRIGRTNKWGWGSKCDRCVKKSQKTNGATGKAGNAKAPAKKPTVSKAKAKKKPAAKKKAPAKKEPAPAPAEAVVTVSARGRVRKKRDWDA